MRARMMFLSVLSISLIYPFALLTSVVIDAAFGELYFLDRLLFESKSRFLFIILSDWISASLWVIPLFLLGNLIMRFKAGVLRLPLILIALGVAATGVFLDVIPQLLGLVIVYSLASPLSLWRRSV